MAMSRNERRMTAKLRLEAKLHRIAKAELGRQRDERQEVVRANTYVKAERNPYPPSCLSNLAGQSHRVFICRATGGMSRRGAMALKAKGSWRG